MPEGTLSSGAGLVVSDTAEQRAPWHRRWLIAARQAYRLQRQRRELLSLDDRTLADIGVTRSEAQYEGSKAFWQRPEPIGHPARTADGRRFRS
jgi:uncharacterized protein YjiS (DUF1127 family)